MTQPTDKESVLYAFAIEETHDRGTLDRYLREHPELAEELIDLSFELRLSEGLGEAARVAVPDPGLDAAWAEFLAADPQATPSPAPIDLFARFRGAAFVGLAKQLDAPRSILSALRDRLVVPSSVPAVFLRRFADAMGTSVDAVGTYLAQASEAPTGIAFKADEKPSPQEQVTFRQLVQCTEMTSAQRLLLLQGCDDDARP